MTHTEIVSFIWDVANLIRDTFKRGKYQDVMLPLTVLRRLDCVLAPTKEKVLARKAELRGMGLEDMDAQLKKASGFAFYNTSRYDFERLLGDAPALAANLRNYIVGFSDEMREVIERFDFDNTISKLDESQLLYQVVERFGTLDLHPDVVDNPTMGTIFEELIRKFNEALDENPGEHFTPRDVVHLMVELMLAGDEEELSRVGTVRSVYDPCCGSGGMLMIAKQRILEGREEDGELLRPAINRDADIHLFGQEVNPETWAVSKSDFFMKDPTGHDASNIAFGSVLSNDRHADRRFDYLIANPPYGKDWKRDKDAVKAEHARGAAGRFGPGLPRISDGQTLFLLHMLARARTPEEGGTRIAIIMNGSPLFTGDAGERRERDPPPHPGERSARGADRAPGTALLQHRHRHLHLAPHQPQGAGAGREGPAHRRHLLLDAAQEEPRGQAARHPGGEGGGHPGAPPGLPGWRDAPRDRRRRRGGRAGQSRVPRDPVRVPKDHGGTSTAAQLPGERGAHRTAGRSDGLREPGQVAEAG